MTDIAPDPKPYAEANFGHFRHDMHRSVGATATSVNHRAGDGGVAGMGRPRVTVVLPTRNEARNLPHVAERMPPIDELVVIDGGSQDGTADVARRLWPHATVIEQTRSGKGNALACGFRAATGDIIVMIDGDGSTDPAEIPRFVEALVDGADLAKGSRFCRDGGSEDITRFRRLGNYGLNWLVNRIFRTQFSDLCYGYNAFWRRNLDCLDLPCTDLPEPQWGDGFEIETVINVRAAKSGWLIREVGSFEGKRLHGNSNLNAVTDGMRVLRTIGREHREQFGGARVPAGAGWSP